MSAEQLVSFIREFGLPLTIFGIFAFAVIKGILRPGGQVDRELAEVKAQLATMTSLFERERADRVTAEANVAKFAVANADVAEAVRDVIKEVIKNPYQERLTGRKRRAE